MHPLNLIRHHEETAAYKRGRADFQRDINPDAALEHDSQALWHEEMAEYLRAAMEVEK